MAEITKKIEFGKIVLRCPACGQVGTVAVALSKPARERSIEVFAKDHRKCERKI